MTFTPLDGNLGTLCPDFSDRTTERHLRYGAIGVCIGSGQGVTMIFGEPTSRLTATSGPHPTSPDTPTPQTLSYELLQLPPSSHRSRRGVHPSNHAGRSGGQRTSCARHCS